MPLLGRTTKALFSLFSLLCFADQQANGVTTQVLVRAVTVGATLGRRAATTGGTGAFVEQLLLKRTSDGAAQQLAQLPKVDFNKIERIAKRPYVNRAKRVQKKLEDAWDNADAQKRRQEQQQHDKAAGIVSDWARRWRQMPHFEHSEHMDAALLHGKDHPNMGAQYWLSDWSAVAPKTKKKGAEGSRKVPKSPSTQSLVALDSSKLDEENIEDQSGMAKFDELAAPKVDLWNDDYDYDFEGLKF